MGFINGPGWSGTRRVPYGMLRAGVWVLAINLHSVGLGYGYEHMDVIDTTAGLCNNSFLTYSNTKLLPEPACSMPANPATPTLNHQPPTQCRVAMP
jgi:hypothetical protein